MANSGDPVLTALVNSQLVREGGTDSESRPIFVFYSCYLPDPSISSYDELLRALIARLDHVVTNDYVVVVFASGSRHKPPLMWSIKAYNQLERKFRKNLKRLFVVHPTRWFKTMMQVFGPVVSPKFAKKVSWVDSLESLSKEVSIRDIHVPRILHDIDKQRRLLEQTTSNPQSSTMVGSLASWLTGMIPSAISQSAASLLLPSSNQFGVSLDTLMGNKGEKGLPRVVSDCIRFIIANGLETEGLFRVSPSQPNVLLLRDQYNNGIENINIDATGGVHSACGLLKLFFRELPVPIFESSMYDSARMIQDFDNSSSPTQLQFAKTTLLPILPRNSYILLRALFQLLHMIHENQSKTLMHSGNLAIVWAPNFVKSANPVVDLGMCAVGSSGGGIGTLVKLCIESWEEIFGQGGDYEESDEDNLETLKLVDTAPPSLRSSSENDGPLDVVGMSKPPTELNRKPSKSVDEIVLESRREVVGNESVSEDVVAAMADAPRPMARSRSPRGLERSVSQRNRHSVMGSPESPIGCIGEALSHSTLSQASRKSTDESVLFRRG